MSDATRTLTAPLEAVPSIYDRSKVGLKGHLGLLQVALAALAYAGPLGGTTGYTSLIIGVGNGLGAPLVFLVLMAVLALFSVGYGAITRYVPNPGAFYAYITAGLGRPAGLGSSFLILVSYFAINVGCYGYSGLVSKQFVDAIGGPDLPWWLYTGAFWALISVLSYFHVAISTRILSVLLILEVIIVFYFDGAVMLQGGAEGISTAPFTWTSFTSGNLGLAFVFAMSLFCGFESTAVYREETRDPERTIPRATMTVVLFIGLFYALACWALITGLGASSAVSLASVDPANIFFIVSKRYCGAFYYDVTSLMVVSSMFAACLAIQNVTTRYTYSLAVDGVFPRYLGVAHGRHHSPHRASVMVTLVFAGLVMLTVYEGLTGEQVYSWFAGLASLSIMCAMVITSLATVVYFRVHKVEDARWSTGIAPGLATLGLAICSFIGIENFPALIGGSQTLASVMLIALFLSFLVGFVLAFWLRTHRPQVYVRIGRQ